MYNFGNILEMLQVICGDFLQTLCGNSNNFSDKILRIFQGNFRNSLEIVEKNL